MSPTEIPPQEQATTAPLPAFPPTLVWIAPGQGSQQRELVLLELQVSDGEDPPADMELTVDLPGPENGLGEGPFGGARVLVPDASGRAQLEWTSPEVGPLTLVATLTDSDGHEVTASLDFVVNGTPSAPTVFTNPGNGTAVGNTAYPDQYIVGVMQGAGSDPEGLHLDHRYEWWVDGVLSNATTAGMLLPEHTETGQEWTVKIFPIDDLGEGPPGEASILIL